MFLRLLLFSYLAFCASIATAQQKTLDSLQAKYPFLKTKQNIILNDKTALNRFYQKLKLQRQQGQVSIVHIGDSHIQADMFSGRVRMELHKTYGNAGRGLVFPYKVARTNEPWNYKSYSQARWLVRRNISSDTALSIGISGITIGTELPNVAFTFKLNESSGLDYRFNKLTLLHQKGPSSFDWKVSNEKQQDLGFVKSLSKSNDVFGSALMFSDLQDNLNFTTIRSNPQQNQTALYGLILENGNPGVLYHTIGVNGAEYQHYNKSEHFFEQLQYLSPDLFIVSLGTNDAYHAGFDKARFLTELDKFVSNLKKLYPGADILLTTPPDSYRKRKYRNPEMKLLRDTVVQYSKENGLACWDFYQIMGGYSSMYSWVMKGLAQADRLHLTSKGYDLQGILLFQAINNGFIKHSTTRH